MNQRITAIFLATAVVLMTVLLAARSGAVHLPSNQQDYEPAQPIAFSHRLHAGDLQLACLYCHANAERSRSAGVPANAVCMNCHRFVTAPIGAIRDEEQRATKAGRTPQPIVSPELRKLYDAMGLDERLQPQPGIRARAVRWTRVHNLPDYVEFDHRPHVAVGVTCQTCHGAVEAMERVRQMSDLSMGWCVNCHRTANRTGIAGKPVRASIDCSTCHY